LNQYNFIGVCLATGVGLEPDGCWVNSNDQQLSDLGISHAERLNEVDKPFWR
jgi:hypothetical protein